MIAATESEISPSLTALSADSYDEDYGELYDPSFNRSSENKHISEKSVMG